MPLLQRKAFIDFWKAKLSTALPPPTSSPALPTEYPPASTGAARRLPSAFPKAGGSIVSLCIAPCLHGPCETSQSRMSCSQSLSRAKDIQPTARRGE